MPVFVRIFLCVFVCFGGMISSASADVAIGSGPGYTLSRSDAGNVLVMTVSTAEYNAWADTSIGFADMQSYSQRIYNHFGDDFDFMMFTSNEATTRGAAAYAGAYYGAKNDTAGIGQGMFDNTAAYGSGGNLQGGIHFTAITGIFNGPSLHELFHRWGADINEVGDGGHWGFAGVGGQLGGFSPGTLTDLGGGSYEADGPLGNSFGTFANGGNGVAYGALELYLMGLIDVDEFKTLHGNGGDIQVPVNGSFTNFSNGEFTADSIDVVNIDDIVTNNGARPAGQTIFKAASILINDINNPISEADLNAFDAQVASFALAGDNGSGAFNFFEATGGRATIDFNITPVPEPSSIALLLFSGVGGCWWAKRRKTKLVA